MMFLLNLLRRQFFLALEDESSLLFLHYASTQVSMALFVWSALGAGQPDCYQKSPGIQLHRFVLLMR